MDSLLWLLLGVALGTYNAEIIRDKVSVLDPNASNTGQ